MKTTPVSIVSRRPATRSKWTLELAGGDGCCDGGGGVGRGVVMCMESTHGVAGSYGRAVGYVVAAVDQ